MKKRMKYPTVADILAEPDPLKREKLRDQRLRTISLDMLLSGAEPLVVRANECEELGERVLSPKRLELLTVDLTYHRPEQRSWTLQLVAGFVEDILGLSGKSVNLDAICLAVRPDGRWVVIDGWHRVCAARLCNKSLRARFIRPASLDVERKLFLILNNRTPLPRRRHLG